MPVNIKYLDVLSVTVLFVRLVLTPLAATKAAKPTTDDQETFFETNVRPLLWEQCEQCHGAKKQESGFRVDAKRFLLTGGDSGPAIIPGDAEQSLLIRAVRRLDGLEVPDRTGLFNLSSHRRFRSTIRERGRKRRSMPSFKSNFASNNLAPRNPPIAAPLFVV
jgi:hypothetical protein